MYVVLFVIINGVVFIIQIYLIPTILAARVGFSIFLFLDKIILSSLEPKKYKSDENVQNCLQVRHNGIKSNTKIVKLSDGRWFIRNGSKMIEMMNVKTKEMLGLVASMVLRCDDCIKYHLEKCHQQGCTTEEIYEIFAVANIVGGTIVIPHTRRGAEFWEELIKQ